MSVVDCNLPRASTVIDELFSFSGKKDERDRVVVHEMIWKEVAGAGDKELQRGGGNGPLSFSIYAICVFPLIWSSSNGFDVMQAVPLFLSDIAPTTIRGGLNLLFQLNVTIGILFATLVNYGAAKYVPLSVWKSTTMYEEYQQMKLGGWGWRVSLSLAGVPALLLSLGSLIVVDTPSSLIQRGRFDDGRAALKRIRGTKNVEAEFLEILEASHAAKEIKHPFRNILKWKNRPPRVIAIAMQIFQQFTGMNAIVFYAPILFASMGLGN
ncbi:hypothetical protein DVH24_013296 [Malus domestica]|uniref:Major facilitator superfamily (MFS) profile domain-containing protein n=1 Tax=Malus domestica TaxID=3750 RepID=A0A498HIL3_MALDO|nr:hypothetical protein DVH24_013296 [Malus domestica]